MAYRRPSDAYKRKYPCLVRHVHKHKCALPFDEELAFYRICEGKFVQLRRRLWVWRTVSNSHPKSKIVLRSTAAIDHETLRHFETAFYAIHPFSKARYCWEMFMIPVFLSLLYLIPRSLSKTRPPHWVIALKTITDVIGFVDIGLWFRTGYYDARKQTIRLNCRDILKNYICGLFIFDLLASLPLNLVLYILDYEKKLHVVKSIALFSVFRIPTFIRYVKTLGERVHFIRRHMKFITFIIWLYVTVAWSVTIVHLVINVLHPDPLRKKDIRGYAMLMLTFRVARTLMTVGVSESVNTSKLIMGMQISGISIGSVLEIVILAKVMQMLHKRTGAYSKYNTLIEEIGEFTKYKELPQRLREKIVHYVDLKFRRRVFREADVLDSLSPILKEEILLHRCQKMVERVEFFQNLPPHVMQRIVKKLKSEIYLPNDVIVLAGYAGHAMYFIYRGTVAVYTINGKEICHLEDGSHFGEIALVINEPRVATVVAVKECEVFKLSRKDFQEAIDPFPELNKKIRSLAMSRLESTLQMMEQTRNEEMERLNSIVPESRPGSEELIQAV